jgi:hypothetical protein
MLSDMVAESLIRRYGGERWVCRAKKRGQHAEACERASGCIAGRRSVLLQS